MKKLSCQIKLLYLKVLYAFLDMVINITKAHPYLVTQKISIGAAIIAASVTMNSCSSSGSYKAITNEKKIDQKEITTTCYDSIAPDKSVRLRNLNGVKKKKVSLKKIPMPKTNEDIPIIECYIVGERPKQSKSIENENDTVFIAEEMPYFKGGIDSLRQFITRSLKYPEEAMELGTSGKVYLQFVISKNGDVTNPKILRSCGSALDNEAVRIVKSMPKWNPGKQNGQNVNVYFTLPITFNLPK